MRYLRLIKKRKNQEYRVLLAIVQNPHTEKPSELWQLLKDEDEAAVPETLDKAGFEIFKAKLKGNEKFIIKG